MNRKNESPFFNAWSKNCVCLILLIQNGAKQISRKLIYLKKGLYANPVAKYLDFLYGKWTECGQFN